MSPEVKIKISALDSSEAAFASVSKNIVAVEKKTSSFRDKVDDLQPAFKKMAAVGTIAFGAVLAVGTSALKEFMDSQKTAAIATKTLSNTIDGMSKDQRELYAETGNVADVFKEVEEMMLSVGAEALKLGYDDDTARLSFSKLFQVTEDSTQAFKDMQLAMDLSAASGRSLEDSAAAIIKVYGGQTRILKDFGIDVAEGTDALIALDMVNSKVDGSAETVSKTLAGQSAILTQQFANLKEQVGAALAPALSQLLTTMQPVIEKMVAWAEQNPDLITKIIMITAGIAALVAGIGFLGLLLPPIIAGFGLIATVIGALSIPILAVVGLLGIIGLSMAYVATNWAMHWDNIKWAAEAAANWIKEKALDPLLSKFEKVLSFINRIKDGIKDIGGKVGNTVSNVGSSIGSFFDKITPFASGGIVTKPTLGLVGEAGPEAIIPLSKAGSLGGSTFIFNVQGDITDRVKREIMRDLSRQMRLS